MTHKNLSTSPSPLSILLLPMVTLLFLAALTSACQKSADKSEQNTEHINNAASPTAIEAKVGVDKKEGVKNNAEGAEVKKAQDAKYSVDIAAANPNLKKGENSFITLSVTAAKGYLIKKETPFSAKLQPSTGIVIAKNKLGKADARYSKDAIALEAAFEAKALGEQSISADLTFFVCDPSLCERFSEQKKINLMVN